MQASSMKIELNPIAYADQKRCKVFVMSEDRSKLIPPSLLRLEDKFGNVHMVLTNTSGDMTVLDVKQLAAGGYFLRILGEATKAIRIILF